MKLKTTLAAGTLALAALIITPVFAQYGSNRGAAPAAAARAAAPAAAEAESRAELNIVETAAAAGQFNTLAAALNAAGLTETVATKGPFTVFAPTDDAFAKVPAETLTALLNDREALTKVLLHHVVNGAVKSDKVVGLDKVETLAETELPVKVEGSEVMIGNARVVAVDVTASNGVIHVIDTVLIPEGLQIREAVAAAP